MPHEPSQDFGPLARSLQGHKLRGCVTLTDGATVRVLSARVGMTVAQLRSIYGDSLVTVDQEWVRGTIPSARPQLSLVETGRK